MYMRMSQLLEWTLVNSTLSATGDAPPKETADISEFKNVETRPTVSDGLCHGPNVETFICVHTAVRLTALVLVEVCGSS
jgi:hypothetical protein